MIAMVFRGQVAADEHRKLFEAVLACDTSKAYGVLRSHIDGCVARVLDTGGLYAFTAAELSACGRSSAAWRPCCEGRPPRRRRFSKVLLRFLQAS